MLNGHQTLFLVRGWGLGTRLHSLRPYFLVQHATIFVLRILQGSPLPLVRLVCAANEYVYNYTASFDNGLCCGYLLEASYVTYFALSDEK